MGSLPPQIDPLVDSLCTTLGITMHDLDQAVVNALKYNIPEQYDWDVTSGHKFLQFANDMLHWVPHENFQAKQIYMTLCLFYFILSQPPLHNHQTPNSPSSVKEDPTPLSRWMVEFARKTGQWLDTPASLTPATLQTFRACPKYRVWEADEPTGGWRTFNEFFGRRLLPGARPISFATGAPSDDRHICHAADSIFNGAWPISAHNSVTVKSLEWSISDFLADCDYAPRFAGGAWMHATLDAFQYHRIHAPVRGRVVEAKVVPGLCGFDVIADPASGKLVPRRRRMPDEKEVRKGVPLDVPEDPGYAFLQARGLITIENPVLGYVTVLPIGMAQVSSVALSVVPGQEVEKGAELAYFQFGGSDLVTMFEEKAKVNFDPSVAGVEYRMGQVLGRAEL